MPYRNKTSKIKVNRNIAIHFFLWFMVPLVIAFFAWIRRPAFYLARTNLPIESFYDVFVENFILVLLLMIVGAISFYGTFYILAPKYLKNNHNTVFRFGILSWLLFPLAIVSIYKIFYFTFDWFYSLFIFIAYTTSTIFLILAGFLRSYIYGQHMKLEKELVEKDRLKMQLALLKSKIDPHFLFNVINNIDVLIETNPVKGSEYLKNLSELLRFTLYRTDEDLILLTEEITYIDHYIALERIRSTNEKFVNFQISGNPEGRFIASMVYIVFIENAMKFVASRKTDKAVEIFLTIYEDSIVFKVTNSMGNKLLVENKDSGKGLDMVKQRLDLLYGNRYDLIVETNSDTYTVVLQIIDQ
ncbi:sensor histidine kinase [Ascidiimonas sp. W6]|uniref:sensor histidine kinase n=1 Tax=Ascidiimonas meishanensis TaxID=3128903 RepID=UPI0030EE448E